MWRDDVLDYLEIFRPESGDDLLNFAGITTED